MSFDWKQAVHQRAEVAFIYDGLTRVVQVATFGTTATGRLTIRGCLVDGESRRNTVPCWELYTVAKIADPQPTGNHFDTFALPGYTKGDSAFVSILAEH